jgi:hypothetical protein
MQNPTQNLACCYRPIILGRYRAIGGYKVIRKVIKKMAMRKGKAPLKTSSRGASLAMLATVNTQRPMGGVIKPAPIMSTHTTPNHIGSKPRFNTTGKMTGSVRIIIDMASKKHPSKR